MNIRVQFIFFGDARAIFVRGGAIIRPPPHLIGLMIEIYCEVYNNNRSTLFAKVNNIMSHVFHNGEQEILYMDFLQVWNVPFI